MTISLTRGTLGRLGAHEETPQSGISTGFATGDFTAPTNITLSITSGRLRAVLNAAGTSRGVPYTALADRADVFLQSVWSATGAETQRAGFIARATTQALPVDMIYSRMPNQSASGGNRLIETTEFVASAAVQTDTDSPHTPTLPQRLSTGVVGTDAFSYAHGPAIAQALAGVGLVSSGRCGFIVSHDGGSGTRAFEWTAFYVMRSHLVTVNGPTATGWEARIKDAGGVVLASAAAAAGVATVDLFAARVLFPLAVTLEIYDTVGAAVLGTITPAETVWGGDVWTWAEAAPAVPDAPTSTSIGATSIGLEWDAVPTADTYKLRRATSPGGPFTLVLETASLSHTDTGLVPLTDYYYTVEACNEAGCGGQSLALEVTTADVVPDIPAAPTVGSPTSSSLTVSWAAVPYATLYDVYRSPSLGGTYVLIGFTASTSYVDTGRDAETQYFYKVSACSGLGCSDLSPAASGTTLEIGLSLPCAMILDVYEDDGEAIAWSVATDPAHPFPYLLFPSNYGAREIDPVNGAASIGTVDVTIADVHETPGDQDSGFVTARLTEIFGRRCRLRRFVSEALGFFVIADGPAGAPRLSESYAGYTFAIRDTRETERRLRAFTGGGTTSIAPVGPLEDWGATDDGPLLPAVLPLLGSTLITDVGGGEFVCAVLFTSLLDTVTDFPNLRYSPRLELVEDAVEALKGVVTGARAYFPDADILWRVHGTADPYNVARPSVPAAYGERLGGVAGGINEATETAGECLTSVTLWAAASAPAGMPSTNGVELDILVRHRGRATADLPYYYEGTLGDLLGKLYARELERPAEPAGALYDPEGLDDPSLGMIGGGVRTDAAAVAALVVPVLLRQTEPVDDGRDWAERMLYAPAGYIPSIDAAGRISPVSRARPAVVTGPLIDDEVSEPSPEWDAGLRVVTGVRFNYRRYFIPGEFANVAIEADGLAVRDVQREYRDPSAEDRHGEQRVEYDASAFGAIGVAGETFTAGGGARPGVPEVGEALANEARYEVLERYRDGAPAFRLAVRRAAVPAIRDGQYCPIDLTWLPDFLTGRRGLTAAAAQVLSVENADCEWVTLLLEISTVVAVPGFYDAGVVTSDIPSPEGS